MKFEFRAAAALGRPGGGDRGRRARPTASASIYDGFDLTIRRGERWCVMGRNGAGKTTLLKMVAGRARRPTRATVRLGASLKMGYFAQQSLDLLDADLDRLRAAAAGLPARERRRAAHPARRVPVLRRRRRQEDPRAVGRREVAPGDGAHAASTRRTSWCSTSRPTTSTSRPRRCWSRRSSDFEGTMIFVSHDRTFLRGLSNRVLELGGESGTEAAAASSIPARTSSTSSAPATRRPACTARAKSAPGQRHPARRLSAIDAAPGREDSLAPPPSRAQARRPMRMSRKTSNGIHSQLVSTISAIRRGGTSPLQ